MTKEQKFYNALRDIFIGAKVEGESGYINLMRIKSRYYEKGVFPKLHEDIEKALKPFSHFRDELFDKLYTFFSRYFSESGSIYFRYTPLHQNIYEKVYTDDKDVMLFYKTHMLYYVKTDRLFKNLEVEIEGRKFFFDVSTLEHKKANEKREIVYSLKDTRKDGTIVFSATHSEKGKKTKVDDILKSLKKNGIKLHEDILDRAFRVFERQSEVDYFINKNAKAFLEEQFNLWLYQYVFAGESEWTEIRIRQLQTLKAVAFKIIAFISQFEDELVKIWNKPKFVLNSNYVITLDKIINPSPLRGEGKGEGGSFGLIEKILTHKNFKAQVEEWQQLGIVDDSFKKNDVIEKDLMGKRLVKKYQYLPIDTKHFKDVELEILGLFDNLDEELDGRLIKSENYQVLNTILPKFQDRVRTIYTDPPFNTAASEILYENKYKHSSWLSLVNDRMERCVEFMSERAILCVAIDDAEYASLAHCLTRIFGEDLNLSTVAVRNNPHGRAMASGFSQNHEYALFFGKTKKATVGRLPRNETKQARYPEKDELGSFAWMSFWKTGAGSGRIERPKLYYPIYVSTAGKIRVPDMHWSEDKEEWTPTEPPKRNESIVRPIDAEKRERVWNLGWDRAQIEASSNLAAKKVGGTWQIYRKYRPNEEGALPSTWWDDAKYSATESGTRILKELFGDREVFSYPKSVFLVEDCLRAASCIPDSLAMDFFGGSGTTAHAVIDLNRKDRGNRKYILIEMGDYCDTVILPRIKKVIFCEKWKDGKAAGGEGISHFMKYYQLEQYEDTLRRVKYDDSDLFDDPNQDPYNQYVFLRDLKLLEALDVDLKKNKVKVNLGKLYEGIDIAETLSNLTGKWIKPDHAEFS